MSNKNTKNNNILISSKKGGNVLASGGFGCVFSPALKCEGSSTIEKGKISKLMTEKHATEEYNEINSIREQLKDIPDYEDYYLVNDLTLCKPAKLNKSDLKDFTKKCKALPKDNITKDNINESLDKLMTLNMPNGGIPVDDYIYNNGSFDKLYELNDSLIKLLKHGILPMNKKRIYHCDIKDSNILVDDSDKTTLKDIMLPLLLLACRAEQPAESLVCDRSVDPLCTVTLDPRNRPEILVDGDRFAVVRPRQTLDELIGLDMVPAWLESRQIPKLCFLAL
jgi:serine/threonine protein kinase